MRAITVFWPKLAATLALLCLGAGVQAENILSRNAKFDIAPQAVSSALIAFSKQSGVQVATAEADLSRVMSNGVVGTRPVREALQLLLKGTGLKFGTVGTNTIAITSIARGATNQVPNVEAASGSLSISQVTEAESSFSGASKTTEDATASSAQSTDELQEIVVTAQKREERLQDVPISMTVLDGESLDRTSQSVVEELRRVPGVAAVASTPDHGSNTIIIRGVMPTGGAYSGTSTVGYYLDSVPFGFVRHSASPDVNAYDLERVEVLRGPQGSLYGVTAVNGVVRVLSKEADMDDLEWKARVLGSSTKNGGGNYRADTAINLPIVPGRFAARVAVGYEDLSGWVDATDKDDVNYAETMNGRIKLKLMATDDLTLSFMSWYSKISKGEHDRSLSDRTIPVPVNIGFSNYGIENKHAIHSLDVQYELSSMVLKSSSSYMDYTSPANMYLGDSRVLFLESRPMTSKVFSEEFSLSSISHAPWSWSVGGIYRDVHDRTSPNLLFASTHAPVFVNPEGIEYDDFSKSFALFGELTRSLFNDTVRATVGVRYFEDDNKIQQRESPGDPDAVLITNSGKFDSVSPRVVLSWLPSADLTAYASYAEGFRSGFSQSPTILSIVPDFPDVQEDKLKNYEIGVKGNALNDLITFDSAVFYIDWVGTQQNVFVIDPVTNVGLNALLNGEGQSGLGAEAGVVIHPSPGLNLTLNGSWNDMKLNGDTFVSGVQTLAKDSRPAGSPEWTANAIVDYEFPFGAFQGFISASANYLSSRPFYVVQGSELREAGSGDPVIFRASLGIHSGKAWTVSLFGENLTDEYASTTGVNPFVPESFHQFRRRPRTVGVQFEYRM